jgi:predicted Rossmann fold nucleotide-binding protein DprA/Smf involved in DNA uptake
MSIIRNSPRARRRRRNLGNTPGAELMSPWDTLVRELRRGAPKKLRTEDRPRGTTPLTARAETVLAALTDKPKTACDLAPTVGLTTAQANTAVLQLSARGLATRTRDGWVRS